MNKHSGNIIAPALDASLIAPASQMRQMLERLRAYRGFLLVVAVPTLIVASYVYLFAADQYQSEAHFLVRSTDSNTTSASGVGQLLGLTGGLSQSDSEGASVADYLSSHDAVAALNSRANIVQRFRRPEADFLSRLDTEKPTPENLLHYYKGKVFVRADHDSGITDLQVRAFRPDDAYVMIQDLLQLSEDRVNELNLRRYNDAISSSQHELSEAEAAVNGVQGQMTALRKARGDIDPQSAGEAQIKLASELNGDLVAAKAQLATMGGLIKHDSPQYIAMARQVRSLEAQSATQSKMASGHTSTIANDLGSFEDLRIRQGFAAKRYEAAAASLEKARDQARRQQLYLTRIVEPNRPVKALYPERLKITLTVFGALLLIYSMGWLLAAGVREHAA